MRQKLTAQLFLAAFLEAYRKTSIFTTEQMDGIWDNSWNNLMMYKGPKASAQLTHSVWGDVATRLELTSWQGEPLTLDGAFYSQGDERQWPPYPILVALEHEYVVRGFDLEIIKLLSVRCPLKVGMIYVEGEFSAKLARLENEIRNRFDEITGFIGEDPRTEYLFLAGAVKRRPFHLNWYAMTFSAAETPGQSHFSIVQG